MKTCIECFYGSPICCDIFKEIKSILEKITLQTVLFIPKSKFNLINGLDNINPY